MNLIERYVLRKLLGAFAIVFPALSLTIWLSQSLRSVSLMTERGQGILTFLRITVLVFPALLMIIAPLSVLIAAIYTLMSLNGDSELVSINASGRSQTALLKPFIIIALLVTAAVASCTLYLTPLSIRASREMISNVNASVVGAVIREGQFRRLGAGLTINVRQRQNDGILNGLFVYDTRDPAMTITYIAAKGALVDNPLGKFLLLQDGVIQRQMRQTGSITVIEFQSYAFDLATLAARTSATDYTPQEQDTLYLFNPSPNDPYFQNSRGEIAAELHDRITSPLYVLVFALVPLVFLGQVRSNRGRNTAIVIVTVMVAVGLRGLGFVVASAVRTRPELVPVLYAIPIGAIVVSLGLIVAGVRIDMPRWLDGLFQGRRPAAAAGS
jgi:lipopolysaccharide export system permease protein